MLYRVGPLRVRADGWPAAWLAHAARDFEIVSSDGGSGDNGDGGVTTVTFDGVGLSADDARDGWESHELVRTHRVDAGGGEAAPGSATRSASARAGAQGGEGQIWHVAGGGNFVGRLDEDERRLTVRARSDNEDPGLALGNALRALVATLLPTQREGLMIHACAGVAGGGSGVIVAGVSTAGKTTLARGFRATTYLTDDVSLIVDASSTPTLVPSPFYGEAGGARRGTTSAAPLRAIGILVDKVTEPGAPSTYARLPSATRAAFELLPHVARFTHDRALSERLLDVTAALAERVPVVLVRRSLADASDDVVRRILAEAGC